MFYCFDGFDYSVRFVNTTGFQVLQQSALRDGNGHAEQGMHPRWLQQVHLLEETTRCPLTSRAMCTGTLFSCRCRNPSPWINFSPFFVPRFMATSFWCMMYQSCLGGRSHGRRVGLLWKPVRRRRRDEPPRGLRRVLVAWMCQPQLRPPARSAGDGILRRRPPASRDPAFPGGCREGRV